MPKGEQIPGETHQPGERIRAMILDVRERHQPGQDHPVPDPPGLHPAALRAGSAGGRRGDHRDQGPGPRGRLPHQGRRVTASTTRSTPSAPASASAAAASRTSSTNWAARRSTSSAGTIPRRVLIANALKPAKVSEIALCFELGRATVVVDDDQSQSGHRQARPERPPGRPADRLGHRHPDAAEYNQGVERMSVCQAASGADDALVDKLSALGIISVLDLDDVGAEPLVEELNWIEPSPT